jgi:hypothetical protein
MLKKYIKFLNLFEKISLKGHVPSKEEKLYALFNGDFYKDENVKKIEHWLFYNYFDGNDSLTEKKYKVAILGLIFIQKKIYISEMPLIDDIVKNISQDLIQHKETNIDLYGIFPELHGFSFISFILASQQNREPSGVELISNLLNEDKHNFEKIDIYQQIYNQFSCLGLLADSLVNSKANTDLLMSLQNSKFNDYDIKFFKDFLKKVTEDSYDSCHSVNLKLDYWNTLISNEYNVTNLNIFKQVYLNDEYESSGGFFAGLYGLNKGNREQDKKYLLSLVEKKIDYLELSNSLEDKSQEPISTNKIKRAKL